MNPNKTQAEADILKLLRAYHHYLFMTTKGWRTMKGYHRDMNLGEFMEWLESRR